MFNGDRIIGSSQQQVKGLMHVHSDYATVLASLAKSTMLPIEQNTATFFNRTIYDDNFDGLAFASEGIRCGCCLMNLPRKPRKKWRLSLRKPIGTLVS